MCTGAAGATSAPRIARCPRSRVDGAVRAYLARDVFSQGLAKEQVEQSVKRAAREAKREATAAEAAVERAERRLESARLKFLDDALSK